MADHAIVGAMRMIATIVVLLSAAPAANAADSFYATYIAEKNGVAPCYARSYDQKHLADHPKQKVVHFFVTHSEAEHMAPPKTFDLSFGFRIKNSTDSFSSEAGCAVKGDGATCSAEGDGGQFSLTPRPDGLLVTVVGRLELEGMESFSPDLMKSDDREFRLYVSPAGECNYGWGSEEEGEDGEDEDGPEPLAPSIQRPG
jgi:hypothetical protein